MLRRTSKWHVYNICKTEGSYCALPTAEEYSAGILA